MGNAQSDVTSAVKKQAEGDTNARKMYQLVDVKGGGMLVDLAKQASASKNYTALDEAIKQRVEPFLYNKGEGKMIHISKIALMRNRERSKHKQIFKNEADYDKYKEPTDCKDPKMFKECCWDLDERGAVGETILHVCLLSASSVHAELCKRLLHFYPKLIVDVYMNDEYYGESVLHIAIVNEDPAMVKFFLENGANPVERCFGSFMCPEDQKNSRNDVLDQEIVICDQNTNYQGYVYWGEYPASFAACVGMEECYRMILAKGADPNAQDSNGNTVLHMLVIHDKKPVFSTAYELGADIHIQNNLNLTPLTLAAKLAKKEVFFHIINISREIYWQIGSVTCAAYPLGELDTIDPNTGGIQKESALNLIVFGETVMHLELMEGPVIDLLVTKWNAFVKARFYRQFILFAIFFLITLAAFIMRPIHKMGQPLGGKKNANKTILGGNDTTALLSGTTSKNANFSLAFLNTSSAEAYFEMVVNGTKSFQNLDGNNDTDSVPDSKNNSRGPNNGLKIHGSCFDKIQTTKDKARAILELLMFLGSIGYLLGAARECHFLGSSMFFENLATAPSRVLFLFSRIMFLVMAIMRVTCLKELEDLIAVIVMLTTAPYFLFFCRGFKTVGPFVTMIYRMITGDLLRFVVIYLVFVMGFSQAYFIIFLSYNSPNGDKPNPLGSPAESIMAMFLVSLQSFDTTYEAFSHTDHEMIAKILFVIYMAIVAILLINMLIAMMGNTYTKIAETKNEWQRQWARIVLVVERGVSPKERHAQQELYSQPMADMSRALVLRLNQSEEEKEEMKDLLDIRRYHDKAIQRRLNKLQTEAGVGIVPQPRHSIVNTLMPGGGNI